MCLAVDQIQTVLNDVQKLRKQISELQDLYMKCRLYLHLVVLHKLLCGLTRIIYSYIDRRSSEFNLYCT